MTFTFFFPIKNSHNDLHFFPSSGSNKPRVDEIDRPDETEGGPGLWSLLGLDPT